MSTRKLAVLVATLVLGVVLAVSWYLHGEDLAARERAETRSTPTPTSWSAPVARSWAAARVALAAHDHGDAPAGS